MLLILTARDHVLLALREGIGYADGMWNLPSGKLETNEDAMSATMREACEEIGIFLAPDKLRMAAVIHHCNTIGLARIGLVFIANHDPDRHGEPVNAEPHKCVKIDWFPVDMLPSNTYRYTAASLAAFSNGEPLRLSGW